MKIPGRKLVGKAEETANVIGVPMTRGLGFADLLKRTFKEAWKDHLDVFAGLDSLLGTLAEALRGDTRHPLPDLHARPIMHYILASSRANPIHVVRKLWIGHIMPARSVLLPLS